MATVCQDIDLSGDNGRTESLLRTPGSVTQALRVAKKNRFKTLYILVSTQHLFLLDHENSGTPLGLDSWNPTAFAPFLVPRHRELNAKPSIFVKDILKEKSDIEKLADIICGLHLSQQPEMIKATTNPDLPTSCTDFDVTTTPMDG